MLVSVSLDTTGLEALAGSAAQVWPTPLELTVERIPATVTQDLLGQGPNVQQLSQLHLTVPQLRIQTEPTPQEAVTASRTMPGTQLP